MQGKDFSSIRKNIRKTQKQMSEILGVSLKAIQSFEQGWRKIPAHVERQTLFLLAMKMGSREQASLLGDSALFAPDVGDLSSLGI